MNMKYKKQIRELIKGETLLTCPSCNRQSLEYDVDRWRCLWKNCHFTTMATPIIHYIAQIMRLFDNLNYIKKLK